MALKSLMVVVDQSKHVRERIDFAASLADRFDAHLVGQYIKQPSPIPAFVMAQIPPEARSIHDDAVEGMAQGAHQLFEERLQAAGRYDRSEWRVARGQPTAIAALLGRYTDLLVVGQPDPDDDSAEGLVDIDELVLSCGRPVLFVPYAYRMDTICENALVAWDASREAARAVSDAMPVLEHCKSVTVLCINPGPELGDEPGADIALQLARHDIKAEASHIYSHDIDPGDALLSRAADLSADLIVMGAYGRPRLRELVLGGVTRRLLRHMTVPVLMSH